MKLIPASLIALTLWAQDNSVPPPRPLEVPTRIGILGDAKLTLQEAVQRVLANDRDLAVSRILREESNFNLQAAKGVYDPRIGANLTRVRSVTPVASLIAGASNGKLTQESYTADPQLNGSFPALGGSYRLDFSSSRQRSDSTFLSVNPQFPTSVNLSLTQPLWRGLLYDDNRHRIGVAKKNVQLTDEQFRQRVNEIVTQAVQAYWELDYAYRNLQVQIEAVHLAEQQDESNRRQLAQGLLAPVDVVATQTQIATFQQTVFAAQQALTAAENSLKTMMLPDRSDLLWGMALIPEDREAPSSPLPQLGESLQTALKQRPELSQSDISIEINRLDLRLSREQAKPQIDAVGLVSATGLAGHPLPPTVNPLTSSFLPLVTAIDQLNALSGLPPVTFTTNTGSQIPPNLVGGYSQSLSALTSGQYTTAQFGLQISVPIRNRSAEAQVALSTAESRRLKAQRQQLEMLIEQDVRNSLQAATSARARFDAAVTARQNAERQYSSEQRQFQAGTSTVFLVLQRQSDLIAARTREVRARADAGEAFAALDRALARVPEAQGIQVR